MEKPLKLVKDIGGFYRVRDRRNDPLTERIPHKDAKEIFDALNHESSRADLLKVLKMQKEVYDELFGHCCSNGLFNAWSKPFDCTKLNGVRLRIEKLLSLEGAHNATDQS